MLIESFLQYLRYEKNYSSHTVTSYRNDLNQFEEFIVSKLGEFNPSDVDTSIVREWIVHLMGGGYSSLSVNRKLSSLKSFFKYLAKTSQTGVHPLRKISGPKTNKPLPNFVKDKDMEVVLDEIEYEQTFDGQRDHAILEVFYMTGMRCAELVGLKNTDIDLGACLIKVTGKRNKQRLIPFSEKLKNTIISYLEIKKQEVKNQDDDSFFVRKDGRSLSNSIVYGIVKKRLTAIPNLSKRSPHVLRHTFATSMLNNGADLNAVKDLLGHASLSSTEVYTHTTFEELKKVYHQAHPRA